MTHKDVVPALAAALCCLLASAAHSQSQGTKLSAQISADAKIISGSDWISGVTHSRNLDHHNYTVTLKPSVTKILDCEASLAANANPEGRPGAQAHVNDVSKGRIDVIVFYMDLGDQVMWEMPFNLTCTPTEEGDTEEHDVSE